MTAIAIIGAMDEEVANIATALSNVTVTEEAGVKVTRGTLETNKGTAVNVAATVGGMGTVNIAATTQHLRYLDTDMRLVGQFKPGTADRPIEEYHSDDRLLELADQALNDLNIHHIVGIIATGNYFVDDPQKVEQVIRETGADAVEMEGAAVAHVAARNDVPALVIRALSDNADTDYEDFKTFDISEYADTAAKLTVNIAKRM